MSDPFNEYADQLVGRSMAAARALRTLSQEQVDRIVEAVFDAAWAARADLARLAHEETTMGTVEDKTVKNAWAAAATRDELKPLRTVGEISHDPESGITEIAEPLGPILGTIPVTNPTSTAIFKALICLKTRNPLIFSAHRGARKCVKETARLLAGAAEAAGAPADSIQNITRSQAEYLHAVMRHRDLALIVATGTGAIVKTARETGTPTLGVGPGNVPVYVHGSADVAAAARAIVRSKTFDNGTICASEQAIIVERPVASRLRSALEAEGCYYCSDDQAAALGPVCLDVETRKMRADVVGQAAGVIAGRAGFDVPAGTRVLVAAPAGVGPEHPLSAEILAPVLAWYEVDDYESARQTCQAVLNWGGIGHTLGVYTTDEAVVRDFSEMPASRILVNQPTTYGAIGGWVNHLPASLTLSCGPAARNILNENITARHLLQIKRVARPTALVDRWSEIGWQADRS